MKERKLIFPFQINLNFKVYDKWTNNYSQLDLLNLFYEEFQKEKFKDLKMHENYFDFKGNKKFVFGYIGFGDFKSTTHDIEYGKFSISNDNKFIKFNYSIKIIWRHLIDTITTLLISIIIGYASTSILVGLIAFVGLTLLITLTSTLSIIFIHKTIVDNIIERKRIENLKKLD